MEALKMLADKHKPQPPPSQLIIYVSVNHSKKYT